MSIYEEAKKAQEILQRVVDVQRTNLQIPFMRAFMMGLKQEGLTMEEYKQLQRKAYVRS